MPDQSSLNCSLYSKSDFSGYFFWMLMESFSKPVWPHGWTTILREKPAGKELLFGKAMRRVKYLCQNGVSGCRIDDKTSKSEKNLVSYEGTVGWREWWKFKGTDQKDNFNCDICGWGFLWKRGREVAGIKSQIRLTWRQKFGFGIGSYLWMILCSLVTYFLSWIANSNSYHIL